MEPSEVHLGTVRFHVVVSDLEEVIEFILMDVVSLHDTKLRCR